MRSGSVNLFFTHQHTNDDRAWTSAAETTSRPQFDLWNDIVADLFDGKPLKIVFSFVVTQKGQEALFEAELCRFVHGMGVTLQA